MVNLPAATNNQGVVPVDMQRKYKDELQRRGGSDIWMWLVAPQISTSVREFLDRIGIEYREIHVGEFRRVAERYGVVLSSEKQHERSDVENPSRLAFSNKRTAETLPFRTQVETGPRVKTPSAFLWKAYGQDLLLTNAKSFDGPYFVKLIDTFEQAVPSRRNATLVGELRRWAAHPDVLHWGHKSNQSLLRWVTTTSYKSAVPHALAIWTYLFGEPAPTWYIWTQSKGYEFDAQGWKVWYQSLSGTQ